jgi:hypothetical protein
VGRLGPMSDTAQADEAFTDTNCHHHTSASHSIGTRCCRPPSVDTAATQTCSVDMGTASGTQRLWCIRALCEASSLRHTGCFCPGHRSSLSRVGKQSLLGLLSCSVLRGGEHVSSCFFHSLCKRFSFISSSFFSISFKNLSFIYCSMYILYR